MRVLVVHNSYRQPGGEDSVVHAEADLLVSHGAQVELHEIENPSSGLEAAFDLARSSWNHRQASAVRTLADQFRPDVVHFHNTWFKLSPAPLWYLRSTPAARIVTLHNYRLVCLNASLLRDDGRCTDCLGRFPWPGIRHRCYRGSAVASTAAAASIGVHRTLRTWTAQVERLVVPTDLARRTLVAGGLATERVTVKHHFVADPGPRLDTPSVRRQVVYAGRLSPEKGLRALVAAWTTTDTSGMELVLIGEGPLTGELAAAGDSVRVEPWMSRSRLGDVLLQSRAAVMPSPMFETFGLAAAEAMAAGIPVVTMAGSAAQEVVGPNAPAPVDPDEARAGWQKAFSALRDGEAVDRWGRSARDRYQQWFSPEAGLRNLLGVYQEAQEERERRG